MEYNGNVIPLLLVSTLFSTVLSNLLAAPGTAAPRPDGIRGPSEPCTIVRVVDGDTADVRIRGRVERLRLLAIDTEESWASPGKPITPFGLETSRWAKGFLSSEEPCFVEYGPEKRDAFDRLLAYLWHKDGETWKNYNLQTVELGYSPYFPKYGYSQHHHEAFVAAEKRAQEAKRGIWSPMQDGNLRGKYLGEGGLRPWWDARAEALKEWDAISADRADLVDARTRYGEIKKQLGKRVTVFTAIRKAKESQGRWLGSCEGMLHEPLAIVAAFDAKGVEPALRDSIGNFRYFTGVPEMADDGKTLLLVVKDPSDVSKRPPPPRAPAGAPAKEGTGKKTTGETTGASKSRGTPSAPRAAGTNP